GFMELDETVQAGAARECFEETHAQIKNQELFGVYNSIVNSQVYIMFRAQLAEYFFEPTSESLEVKLFQPDEIPWDNISFPIVNSALKRFVKEMQSEFTVQLEDVYENFEGSISKGYFDKIR
ncbi:MAG: NUDIX domain-containing protein, partial [Xanthomonadales bacterium]|nr:NUDIX domain-containing protein [Xanthomonadales bacterium]